jgi:2-polyprenyl-6-methoxyphenol hydroxylase-like FAD-dependent oxidoreductase
MSRSWVALGTAAAALKFPRLPAPRVVLLGDAAHAVSAAFGQGVNSALELGSLGGSHAAL